MKKFGVGIIGIGIAPKEQEWVGCATGKHWVESFKTHPMSRVIAVCDIRDGVKDYAREAGIPYAYTDYEDLVKREDIDIVVICSPDGFHTEQAIAALEEGKHVIVEKPMAVTVKQCQAMVGKVKETGLKLLVNQSRRFVPRYRAARQLVTSGALGDIFYVEGEYILYFREMLLKGYRSKKEHNHFPLLGAGCHAIDFLLWAVGDITEVTAYGNQICYTKKELPFEDCMTAIVKFKNGAIGRIMSVYGCRHPHDLQIRIFGTNGTYIGSDAAALGPDTVYLKDYVTGDVYPEKLQFTTPASAHRADPTVDHFIRCILNNNKPLCDVVEGAKAVTVALAAKESIDAKRAVIPVTFK